MVCRTRVWVRVSVVLVLAALLVGVSMGMTKPVSSSASKTMLDVIKTSRSCRGNVALLVARQGSASTTERAIVFPGLSRYAMAVSCMSVVAFAFVHLRVRCVWRTPLSVRIYVR